MNNWTWIIVIVLLILAGCCNGIMDALQFHYMSTGLPLGDYFWNPELSWMNKYKNGEPSLGPRFFGSTTFLVFLTDAWHLFKFLFLAFIRAAIVVLIVAQLKNKEWYFNVLRFVVLWLLCSGIQSLGFHLFYTLIL